MNSDKRINKKVLRNMRNPFGMDRRDFMKRFGTGVMVAFSVGKSPLKAGALAQDETPGVNAFLKIGEDGRVTVYAGKIEMGQGPITSLPMEVADELDVRLEDVDMIMADTDLCPWNEGTYGSLSTRVFGQVLRGASAKARAILIKMAAKELGQKEADLETRDGFVIAKTNNKKISYGQLSKGKEIMETSVGDVPLKKSSEFRVMGKPRLRVDSPEKVTGEAKYAGDIQLPGMLCARILRPPSLGAKLLSVDTSKAESMEGVKIVKEGDLVAVLHASQHMAGKALATLKAEWEEEKVDINHESLFDHIQKVATERRVLASEGDLAKGKEASVKEIKSVFKDPYIAHSPIENHTATAVMEEGKLKVWASCQTPYPTRDGIAEELGMEQKDVQLLPIFVGGGFGGKIYNPQAIEAARLAKLTGKPIQLSYTREEEFTYDRLRPAALIKADAGLDKDGRISYWDFAVHLGGGRESETFYDVPHSRTSVLRAARGKMDHPFYTGAWRAPSVNTNTFARESQMDILAAAAGIDPVEFRLRHLEHDPRMANVVKTGAERFGWTPAKGPSGRGYGFAVGIDVGSYVVVFLEVEVDKNTGYVQVKRAVCVQDMGMVVNPQGAMLQMEGCILMGLGYALREEIQFEGRKMLTTNYDSYAITQFNMVPEIDVHIVDSKDETPYGGGEPPVVVMGGAVANAVFDAVGARVYREPLTPERVKEALG